MNSSARSSRAPAALPFDVQDGAPKAQIVSAQQAVDIAEKLNRLERAEAVRVLETMPVSAVIQVFNVRDLGAAAELLERMPVALAAAILGGLQPDRRAQVFRQLTDAGRARLKAHLPRAMREALDQLLQYPAQSAGGLMTTEYVAVPADWTVARTLQHIHDVGRDRETVYTVCVLEPGSRRLLRVIGLWRLVVSEPQTNVLEAAQAQAPVTVSALTDREEVARLLSKYNLLAVPVVADDGGVLGIVTVDDVIDAIIAEGTEDVQKFGGSQAFEESYVSVSFATMIRKRAGWLCALFFSEMLTASAMQAYQGEIEKAVVLALFIPLIMSSGGNSGSQATSLVIRALALREIGLADWWRIASRELPTGLALGSILGAIGWARIVFWQQLGLYDYGSHWGLVALTVGLALAAIVTFGSLTGSMLPFALKRLGFDPATASAPFVATLVDVTGLVIYFSVAYLVLRGTLL
jgi:magnesium transporter